MNRLITIMLIALFCLFTATTYAQRVPIVHISKSGKQIPIISTSFADSVSAQDLKSDPFIHVRSDEGEYIVNRYDISHLPKRGELSGPFSINGDTVNNMKKNRDVAQILGRIKKGDRLYIENINAVCATCEKLNKIKIKSLSLLIN